MSQMGRLAYTPFQEFPLDLEPGLAVHVVLGDLGRMVRSRWLDGHHQRIAPSPTYPLSALPMEDYEPGSDDAGEVGDQEDYTDATA